MNWKKVMELLKNQISTMVIFVEKLLQSAEVVYFLRTSTCFNHPALLKKYDKTVRDGLSNCSISRMADKRSKSFNAHQGNFGSG